MTRAPKAPMKAKAKRVVGGGSKLSRSMRLAIENVARFGDTDIFPYPIERQVIRDRTDGALSILLQINKTLDQSIHDMPIESERLLQAVGYTGFRQGTQIDPIWNLCLLGMVILIGNDIEAARVPASRGVVFSYRFAPDTADHSLFAKNHGWVEFQKRAVELARSHKYVLSCDISDFYPRVYHHRLENALKKATQNTQAIAHIKRVLSELARGASYGLPVGGPAARLLSELLLNRVDRLLARGCTFCRFVDDYYLFAQTQEDAYSGLVYLSETLLENEGLSLQKTKTRIMSASEFLDTSAFSADNVPDDPEQVMHRDFLALHIHYDPYSETAVEDYETLKAELTKFDIVGMLAAEMQKSRISETLTRKLVRALRYISGPSREAAITSLTENLPILYPILPTVMMVLRDILPELSSGAREALFAQLRRIIETNSYLCAVPTNLAFVLRVLAADDSEETDATLMKVYSSTASTMIKRDVILILAAHNADYWISAQLKRYNSCTLWERRALLVGSYILEDEGEHWRKRLKGGLSPFDVLVVKWVGDRKQAGTPWDLG